VLGACGSAGATFSTGGLCLADGRAPGAYPGLEALVPRMLAGKASTAVDSGRNCSAKALGTLTAHDVHELHFAGATWDFGSGAGTSIAVLALPSASLPIEWVEEFYTAGALNGTKTDNVKTSQPTFDIVGKTFRIDALNDLSQQSIVLWADGSRIRAVIVASPVSPTASMADHDARVASAVAAAAALDAAATGIPVVSPP
jgi:hypothetical protein